MASSMLSRTAGRGGASAGTSGAGEGEIVAEHLSLKDFKKLLKLLKIKLPKKVLNDLVISKSRYPCFSRDADIIVQKLKNTKLRIVQKPRLQCRKVDQAINLKPGNKLRDMTEMIFFQKRKSNEKSLKEKWEKIPLNTHRGLRMKETFRGPKSAVGEKMRRIKTHSQQNEMKCLQAFIKKKGLSGVRYRREHAMEFGFLSGRMDFLLKTKGNKSGTTEYIMLECKGTKKDLKNMFDMREGRVSSINLENKYHYQTEAYMYLLKKTKPQPASVRAAVMIRKSEEDDEDDEDDMDDEEDEETDEEESECQDNDKEYKEYKVHKEKLKGKFGGGFVIVNENTKMFEELNKYCKKKALPLYLAVLNKIFEKVERKKKLKRKPNK